ncbi:MAG: XRE family transcriptional regulator [Candidatus Latescibacteria bacterium]|nr:XRE family transcriptional regulator [Candidatus Latescibacterota bacterium]
MSPEKSWASVRTKLLKYPEFRDAYDEQGPEFERVRSIIEARLRHNMSQADLAQKIKTCQPSIARLENPEYQGGSLSMLRRIAEATDSRLVIRLEPKERERRGSRRKFERALKKVADAEPEEQDRL